MVCGENRTGALEEVSGTKEKTTGKRVEVLRLNSCAENRRSKILSSETNKKEAAKPLYLLRYE
jgi:hypothetical protein